MLFHISDILTITTERLVSSRHIQGVYEILNHMTGDNLFTHQLPRAGDTCAPILLERFPQLASADVEALDREMAEHGTEEGVKRWVAAQVLLFGEHLDVEPIENWEHINPLTELAAMVGPDKPIIVLRAEGNYT